ncbi:MAG: 7-cyano-7-deazaguanine synthase QueC, partial [Desulfovibrio sp.]|nr:7-cyano-7-deazaguanine synthase QueC [Desulfovibrio sp.]
STCLFSALLSYDAVWTLGFQYGQRHAVELECRKAILDKIRAWPRFSKAFQQDIVLALPSFPDLTQNALMHDLPIVCGESGIPSTFVPGRNLIFLSFAAAYAYEHKADTIVLGVGEADYSGYPDCRAETISSMEQSLSLGLATPLRIDCPLMNRTKAETWELAYATGGKELVDYLLFATHTCYRGERKKKYAWGYGCGTCPSCVLRKNGWEAFLAGRAGQTYKHCDA